ncbi:MAG: hypothetical protein HOP17_13445 [Acidobacteria bacterium]|nr:hypothetical protein [Acidobacteriota bacterium]
MYLKLYLSAFLLVFVCLGASTATHAQTIDEKWNKVVSLAYGTRIFVETDGRKPLKGKFVKADDRDLTVKVNAREVAVSRDSVSAVYFGKRPSKVKRGLIGALAGAGAGVLIGGIAAAAGADPLIAAGGFLYGLPAGAVIGVATSGGMKQGSLIYAR